MEYTGRVKGGVVLLEQEDALAEGTVVRITPVARRERSHRQAASPLGTTLLGFAGKAKGLPNDLARNHDHYLYGTAKE
jgi:hypothetical protein